MPTTSSSPDETLSKLRSHQGILVDFARIAAESTDLQRLLELACHHAARAVGVSHSKVMQYCPDRGDLLMVAGRGWGPGVVGNCRLGSDMRSPPGAAYQTRDAVRIADLLADPNYRPSQILREHDIRAVLNAPIAIDGIVWGVIEVDSTRVDLFDADDERFLLGLSLVAALAVQFHQSQQERESSAGELARKLDHADTLLSEQDHRVRNYFQLILAILAKRRKKQTDADMRAEFDRLMERVAAVALAHDQLSLGRLGRTLVAATNYIEALCLGLEHATESELRIERDIQALHLRADRIVPIGLIVNELLTNAIKYSVKEGRPPTIKVCLTSNNDGTEAALTVSDNGPGMGTARSGSMGLQLVESLASQLSGRVEIQSSDEGTAVSVLFPIVD
jgi:two-component sensor histidine kinase